MWNHKKIGLLGHSEGGQIGAGRCGRAAAPLLSSFPLAGPGVNGVAVMTAQTEAINRSMGLPENLVKHNTELQRGLMQLVAGEPDYGSLQMKLRERLQSVYHALDSKLEKNAERGNFR